MITASPTINRAAFMDVAFKDWVTSRVYRHLCCDWGQVPSMVAEQNFASLILGTGAVVSRWPFESDALIIVQDSERERVTVVFESEKRVDISGPQHQEV